MNMVQRARSLLIILALVMPVFAQGTPSDDKIYDTVHQKLANDPDVRGAGFEVLVKNGAVTL
jgi:hypothetical protein